MNVAKISRIVSVVVIALSVIVSVVFVILKYRYPDSFFPGDAAYGFNSAMAYVMLASLVFAIIGTLLLGWVIVAALVKKKWDMRTFVLGLLAVASTVGMLVISNATNATCGCGGV